MMRAYLQLLRLPNVFTAMADVLLGFLFTHRGLEPFGEFALLLAASSLMYLAGMALNDVFDLEQDTRERPSRPLPSARISLVAARGLGFGLLAAGLALGWAASGLTGDVRSGVVATALAAMVFLYDRVLKRTPLGPLAMGACRTLNVLLGMSAADDVWQPVNWVVAVAIGLYIVGVTIFARKEAARSLRPQLVLGLGVMIAGLALLTSLPAWATGREWPPIDVPGPWHVFWGLLSLLIAWRCLRAILDPRPQFVQDAVRNSIFSLVILDAGACLAVQDFQWGVVILALLIPTMTLGRWIYST